MSSNNGFRESIDKDSMESQERIPASSYGQYNTGIKTGKKK